MREVNGRKLAELLKERPQTPDGEAGGVKVAHEILPVGKSIDVVSMRNAVLMGVKPMKVNFDEPLVIRSLTEKGQGTWMTDQPQEVWQMWDAVQGLKGRVLIGGLGLGIASTFARLVPKVKTVLTVEKNPDVFKLVAPAVVDGRQVKVAIKGDARVGKVIQDDLYEYLKQMTPWAFDSAFFDTWQGTGESTWVSHVVPLRRLCRGKFAPSRVKCWLEEEMHGQLFRPLSKVVSFDESIKLPGYYQVFKDAALKRGIRGKTVIGRDGLMGPEADFALIQKVEGENAEDSRIQAYLRLYLTPGTDYWEQEFGGLWDELVEAPRRTVVV